ncbi:MAG: hypothetical protein JHC33_12955 [Ignisphaera sp.]|nr:hypothetical protein [Ignisphaera sp.]
MNTVTLEEGKAYVTRGGDKVTILKTGLRNMAEEFTCAGIITRPDGKEEVLTWSATGKFFSDIDTCLDLMGKWNPYHEFKVGEVIQVWDDHYPNCKYLRRFKEFDTHNNKVAAFIDGTTESLQTQWRYWQYAEKVKC